MKNRYKARGEIIGSKVTVVEAKNPLVKGLTGQVVDETKNTFKISTINGWKTIIKNQCELEFDEFRVHGSKIDLRPEERTKKIRR